MAALLERLKADFDPSSLVDAFTLWLPNLLVAVITGFGFWLVHKAAGRALAFIMSRAEIDATAVQFMLTLERYTIGAIGLLTVLGQLGVDVTSIIASLGIAGLTLGFAAQDALGNIIAGMFIFWDRPFVIGDLVEIDGKYGRVDTITMRSTRVVTVDGKMLAIPNRTIVNSTVTSYTNFPHIRLDVQVTVGVNENVGNVRRLLLSLVEGKEQFMDTPAPQVVVKALNDYNVEMELRVWLTDEQRHISERFALREAIFDILNENGVEMPFETLQLTGKVATAADSPA